MLAVLFLLLTIGSQRAAAASSGFVMPPASEGVIDGKEALLIWPSDESGALLDPAHCEVHMIPADEPDHHLTYPCGHWFLPPRPQRYDFWLEQGNRISGSQDVLFYSGGASQAGFLMGDRLGPAGFVRVVAPPRSGESFRIVSLGSDNGFELRLSPAEIRSTVRVPAGLTLGGIFDGDGNALALTRAIEVTEARTVTLSPAAPVASKADLLVVLDKWGAKRPTGVRIELHMEHGSRAPDILAETQSRVIAVWYGLDPGAVRATVAADGADSAVLPVVLARARVSTIRSLFPVRAK